jgi:hypothetical protein
MRFGCLLAVVLFACLARAGQRRGYSRTKQKPSDISVESAFNKANIFLSSIWVSQLDRRHSRVVLTAGVRPTGRSWVFMGNGYNLYVSSPSGRVTQLNNIARIDWRRANKVPVGAARYSGTLGKRHVLDLAKKLGVSPKAKITKIGLVDVPDRSQIDVSCAGFGVIFSIGKKPVAGISVDTQNGTPLDMWIIP